MQHEKFSLETLKIEEAKLDLDEKEKVNKKTTRHDNVQIYI